MHFPKGPLTLVIDLFKNKGMSLVIEIPAIVPKQMSLVMKPIDPKDMIPVPICLVTRKGAKPAGYDAIERFLLNGGLIEGFSSL